MKVRDLLLLLSFVAAVIGDNGLYVCSENVLSNFNSPGSMAFGTGIILNGDVFPPQIQLPSRLLVLEPYHGQEMFYLIGGFQNPFNTFPQISAVDLNNNYSDPVMDQWHSPFVSGFGGASPLVAKIPKSPAGDPINDWGLIFGGAQNNIEAFKKNKEHAIKQFEARSAFHESRPKRGLQQLSLIAINPNAISEGLHFIGLNTTNNENIPPIFAGSLVYVNYTIATKSERGLLLYGGADGDFLFPSLQFSMYFFELPPDFPPTVPSDPILVSKRVVQGQAPEDRMGHNAVFFTNNIDAAYMVVFGGFNLNQGIPNTYFQDIWKFHLPTNIWEEIPFSAGQRPSPRGYAAITALSGNTFLLFGGQNPFGSLGDSWVFDSSNPGAWTPLPLPDDAYDNSCVQTATGAFVSYSQLLSTVYSYGGFVNASFPQNFISDTPLANNNGNTQSQIWSTKINSPSTIVADFASARPKPVPTIVKFFPLGYILEAGTIILPSSGLAGLVHENESQIATFIAPVDGKFRARFFFAIEGIEADPEATWNFTFVYSSVANWDISVRESDGSDTFLTRTNTKDEVASNSSFRRSIVSVSKHPLSNYIAVGKNAQNFTFEFRNLLDIVIESVDNGVNITTRNFAVRDVTPTTDVDSMSISMCLQCPPPPAAAVVNPPNANSLAIGLGVGLTGVVVISVSVVMLFVVRNYRKKKQKLDEETELPEALKEELATVGEVSDVVIERQIGSGNFGQVYLGLAFNKSTKVALKKQKNNDGKSLLQELSVLSSLNHPNVVRFYGIHTDSDSSSYIVTEYVDQGSLVTYLEKNIGKIDDYDLLKMAIDAAKGMAYLAAKGVCHRDLSARNLLVDSSLNVKVADFGLAKPFDTSKLANDDEEVISVRWAAPEVLLDQKYSEKSDVWSFGITLYEIVTYGSKPYPGLTNLQVVQKLSEEKYRMDRPKGIPDSLWDVMYSCWSQNPEIRPNFGEIVKQLEHVKEEMENEDSSASEEKNVDKNTARFRRGTSKKATLKYYEGNIKPYGSDSFRVPAKESSYEKSTGTPKKENDYHHTDSSIKPSTYEVSVNVDRTYSASPLVEKKPEKENEYAVSPSQVKKGENHYDFSLAEKENAYEMSPKKAVDVENHYEVSPGTEKGKKKDKKKDKKGSSSSSSSSSNSSSSSSEEENVYGTSPNVKVTGDSIEKENVYELSRMNSNQGLLQ